MTDYSPFSADQQRDHAEEARQSPMADPLIDLNAHLADIVKDVGRVSKVLNEDGAVPCIGADAIKSKLSDISNALDDLYNEIRGI